MKKTIILVVLLLICFILIPKTFGPKTSSETELEPPETVTAEFAALETFIGNSENPDLALAEYLEDWGEENDFKVSKDKHKNVLITRPPKKGFESAPSTILHGNNKYIASALFILETSKVSGSLSVLYTYPDSGAPNLSKNILDADYLISIDGPSQNHITTGASGREEYVLSKNLQWVAPENNNAFQIKFEGFSGGEAGWDAKAKKQNPIKIAGNFLASAKSQGMIIELGSINGGLAADTMPTDVAFTVVVNDYDANRINVLFEKTSDSFSRNYGSAEKDAVFTITPIETPEKVVSRDCSNSIVSYLYGFINGIYSVSESEDDSVEASSNLGSATTYTGNFLSNISITSSNREKTAELNDAHYKLSYLSGMEYKFDNSIPIWKSRPGSSLFNVITQHYKDGDGKKIKTITLPTSHDCAWFAEKNPAIDMIWMSVEKPEETILKFLGD